MTPSTPMPYTMKGRDLIDREQLLEYLRSCLEAEYGQDYAFSGPANRMRIRCQNQIRQAAINKIESMPILGRAISRTESTQ